MSIQVSLQPDQQARLWDRHVSLYESVFEPVTLGLARKAIDALGLKPGARIIDSGAGAGGAALELARRGARVTAIDASAGMVARIMKRAADEGLQLEALVMDGQRLAFAHASFDAALSVFGVILFPAAEAGLAELRRVIRPRGRVALITWTEPQAYELASELRAAAVSVLGELPAGELPAQLRFTGRDRFQALFEAAGWTKASLKGNAHKYARALAGSSSSPSQRIDMNRKDACAAAGKPRKTICIATRGALP
jgi:ubiquinone/menaquinone biosynthesis C-methylase UbiE